MNELPKELEKILLESVFSIITPLSEAQWAQRELDKMKNREHLYKEEDDE